MKSDRDFLQVEHARAGDYNMRVDAELLHAASEGRGGARIYEWDGPWVSLGTSQSPDRDLIDPAAIRWVRRPTGGKAVLHGHDVTVSIACPLSSLCPDSRKVTDVYRRIIAPIIAGLNGAGISARLAADTPFGRTKGRTSDCFSHISPIDVVDATTGRKLVGCALRVTREAVLAQCSAPVGMPLVDPAEVFRSPHVPQPLEVGKESLVASIRRELASFLGTNENVAENDNPLQRDDGLRPR